MHRDIDYYKDYLSDADINALEQHLQSLGHGLRQVTSGPSPPQPLRIPTEALPFLSEIYNSVRYPLSKVLAQRVTDRAFIDARTKACAALNISLHRGVSDPLYATVIGQKDAEGRVVVGPLHSTYAEPQGDAVAPLPEFMQGSHVTLFGLASSEQACNDAINVFKRKLPEEPEVVEETLRSAKRQAVPKWGVDAEDSQPPFQATFMRANANLSKCVEEADMDKGKDRETKEEPPRALAFKRIPGLAIPSTFLFHGVNPYPLHVYDLAMHAWRHWNRAEALVFYVPKLESEEEAAYVKVLIDAVEESLHKLHPEYVLGSIRVLVVLENPRALFRVNEIMTALYPYFAGASLGWHDFLAGTARLLKNDPQYRIPVKADADIVIKHVKASHELVARVVGKRGGVCIGGMYGWIPTEDDWHSASFQLCIKGYIKNVLSQLKRGLIGFWIPREDYFRIGQALVEAFGDSAEAVEKLIRALLKAEHQEEVVAFWRNPDVDSLDPKDPNFHRALIVANLEESSVIPNNSPDEISLNAFQSIQYLTAWLAGDGCVALPAVVAGVAVRVMDDLATVERSRWEVWHEVHHGRVSVSDVVKITHEEMNFIRRDLSTATKRVQVPWNADLTPLATKIFLKLVTDKQPCEFVTEILLKFTANLGARLGPESIGLDPYVERFAYYFERCGSLTFAEKMAQNLAVDLAAVEAAIMSFDKAAICEAASFHGDIGKGKRRLDKMASKEQQLVFQENEAVISDLCNEGDAYLAKFGVKFLVAAKGKSGKELLGLLRERMNNTEEQELQNARVALWKITQQRIQDDAPDTLLATLETLRAEHKVMGASVCISADKDLEQCICLGRRSAGGYSVTPDCFFQIASLSKTIASSFCIEYFTRKGISLDTAANKVLEDIGSSYRIPGPLADQVTLQHLMSHSALNMHYVNGRPPHKTDFPTCTKLIIEGDHYDNRKLEVVATPGTEFHYSGGGFMLLQHIIETSAPHSIGETLRPFLNQLGIASELSFEDACAEGAKLAFGHHDDGKKLEERLRFPEFAAGAEGSPRAVLRFLKALGEAYGNTEGSSCGSISHDTAVKMVHATDKGCMAFMGCRMGVGVFVAEAGPNRFLVHQGANDGYRAIFLYCFDGPSKGKGVVMCANGENEAMLFIAKAMRAIVLALEVEGVDAEKLRRDVGVDMKDVPQEEIVNMGYKALLFEAFTPTLPPTITRDENADPRHPMASFNRAVGAQPTSVTNERFARSENVFSPFIPTFDPHAFCPMGKVMDSWETARHNPEGVDRLIAKLKATSNVHYVEISTRYHLGNQAEAVQVKLRRSGGEWQVAVKKLKLEGHSEVRIKLREAIAEAEEVMVEIFPDGGLSRVALFDKDLPEAYAKTFLPAEEAPSERCAVEIPQTKKPLQLIYTPTDEEIASNKAVRKGEVEVSSLAFGGKLEAVTDEHYGPAAQVLSPFMPLSMHDGFESARSRTAGHVEEVILRMGEPSVLTRLEFDFTYFVNNNPLYVQVLALDEYPCHGEGTEIVAKTFVKPFAGNTKVFSLEHTEKVAAIKVKVFPDGGINRVRAFAKC